MNFFLLKTEPDDYNIDTLARDGETVWDGVENALALKHLRAVKKGDKCFIYHTGKEKRIVGLAEAIADASNEKDATCQLKFLEKFVTPLSLAEMKNDDVFQAFELLRLPRLSVMPVPNSIVQEILKRVR